MAQVFYEDREEIEEKYKWNLELMYKDEKEWNSDISKLNHMIDKINLLKGKLDESSENLLEALELSVDLDRTVSKVYSYASMSMDQDTRDSKAQEKKDKALKSYVLVMQSTSFLTPEILAIDESKIESFLKENKDLKLYKHFLEDLFRQKDHILTPNEEKLLAKMGEVAEASQQTFGMLNNADLKFPTIEYKGEKISITHGNFIPYLKNDDRELRKLIFKEYYKTYSDYKNTFAQTLSGNVKKNIFNAEVRGFNSSLEAALSENNVDVQVYDNLIESVHDNLDAMYKYMDIRKRALGLDQLHMYDIYTPIIKDYKIEVDYEKAKNIIIKALKPLGESYLEIVEEGFNNRWIDVYENRGKRSGAYSGGCYDSLPYILLNYHNDLDSMFTTIHEMGHSMHSYLTRENQAPVYGGYSIFVAEVASTTNEALLLNYLLDNVESKEEKLFLLNHYLEQFRSTVFRQTMFAEFEKIIYEYAENGGSLTADYLSETYSELNKKYYGEDIIIDEEIAMEWARIPHFYYNYYVFQYATGYSAAMAFSDNILNGSKEDTDKYLDFLRSGSSDYPLNVLQKAGVDMKTKAPVNNALKIFRKLVDEMDKLI